MYTCHLCATTSKSLRGLLGKHSKKHINSQYSKMDYKRDILIHNGRPPKICPVCNKETMIPKGESEFPQYHKACHFTVRVGADNANYRGGKSTYTCRHCNETFTKHSSLVLVDEPFCSTLCTANYYSLQENATPTQQESRKKSGIFLKQLQQTDEFKIKQAQSIAKLQKNKKSNIEDKFHKHLSSIHPDAIDQHIVKYYAFDSYVPSTSELFEVQGNYWHGNSRSRARDCRKHTFAHNNGYKLYAIWENEIHTLPKHEWINCAKRSTSHILLIDSDIKINHTDKQIASLICAKNAKHEIKAIYDNGGRAFTAHVYLDKPPEKLSYMNVNFVGTEEEFNKWLQTL